MPLEVCVCSWRGRDLGGEVVAGRAVADRARVRRRRARPGPAVDRLGLADPGGDRDRPPVDDHVEVQVVVARRLAERAASGPRTRSGSARTRAVPTAPPSRTGSVAGGVAATSAHGSITRGGARPRRRRSRAAVPAPVVRRNGTSFFGPSQSRSPEKRVVRVDDPEARRTAVRPVDRFVSTTEVDARPTVPRTPSANGHRCESTAWKLRADGAASATPAASPATASRGTRRLTPDSVVQIPTTRQPGPIVSARRGS